MRPDVAAYLDSLYNLEPQIGLGGIRHELADIPCMHRDRAEALTALFRERRPARSAEVGFAYGHSTVHFLAAMEEDGFGQHTAIDPYQDEWWHGIGLKAVERLKLAERFTFIQRFSFVAFAQMFAQRQRLDFLFIDGDHKFDFTIADVLMGDMLTNVSGVIVIDDSWMPAVQKVAEFIRANCRHLRELQGVHPKLVAFEKVTVDKRGWDHFVEF